MSNLIHELPERTFHDRLLWVLGNGNLRVSDLARWFDRPHPTVNGWVKRGLNPSGGPDDVNAAYVLLAALETMIKRKRSLPVRQGLSPSQRVRLIRKLRHKAITDYKDVREVVRA